MKKLIGLVLLIGCVLIGFSVTANANDKLNYTLEDGVLTLERSDDFEGELVLPTPEMGEVDKIVIELDAFYYNKQQITKVSLTANEEIVLGCGAFSYCNNLKEIELCAKEKIFLGGARYDYWERDADGCFEHSGVESVVINTGHLDMSEGFVFYNCECLENWECNVQSYDEGYANFLSGGSGVWGFLPWIEEKNGYVSVCDTIIAYSGDKEKVFVDKKNISPCAFYGNKNVKHIVMSDEWTEIPCIGEGNLFNGVNNLMSVKLSENITQIPNWCFYNIEKLKSIWLGKNISEIGVFMLGDYSEAVICYEGNEEEWESIELVSDIFEESPSNIGKVYQKYLDTLGKVTLRFNSQDVYVGFPYEAKDIEVSKEGDKILLTGSFVPNEAYIGESVVEDGDAVGVVITFEKDGKPSSVSVCELFVGGSEDGVIDFPQVFSFEFKNNEYDVGNICVLAGVDAIEPIGSGNLGIALARWR